TDRLLTRQFAAAAPSAWMFPASITGFGTVAIAQSMAGQSMRQMRQQYPDLPEDVVTNVGTASGMVQGVIERMSNLTGIKILSGKLPRLTNILNRTGVTNPALRAQLGFAAGAASVSGIEYTEEMLQGATDKLFSSLAADLHDLDPDTDWGGFFKDWLTVAGPEQQETLLAVTAFGLIGGAGAGFNHFRLGSNLQNARNFMRANGFTEPEIRGIVNESDPQAAATKTAAALKSAQQRAANDPEEQARQQEAKAAYMEMLRANNEALAKAGMPRITREFNEFTEENQWLFLDTTTGERQTFDTEEQALEAWDGWRRANTEEELDTLRAVGESGLIEFLTAEGQAAEDTEVQDIQKTVTPKAEIDAARDKIRAAEGDLRKAEGPAAQRRASEALAAAKDSLDRIEARVQIFLADQGVNPRDPAAVSEALRGVVIKGKQFARRVKDQIVGYTIQLFNGREIQDIAEEFAESNISRAFEEGLLDPEILLANLLDFQEASGIRLIDPAYRYTPGDTLPILEGFSKLARGYLMGEVRSGLLPAEVAQWLEMQASLQAASIEVARQLNTGISYAQDIELAGQLREAMQAGYLPPRLERQLKDALGIDPAAQAARLQRRMEEQIAAEAMEGFPEIAEELRGRLPHPETLRANGHPLAGEVRRIWDSLKKPTRRRTKDGRTIDRTNEANAYFLPPGEMEDIDRVRQSINQRGFDFDTPAEMLDALDASISYGKPFYGTMSAMAGESWSMGRSTEMDARYLELAKDPEANADELRAMVEAQMASKGYSTRIEGKLDHTAPNSKDASEDGSTGVVSLANLKKSDLVPDDYWTRPELYVSDSTERESHRQIMRAMHGKRIRVYRSIPKSAKDAYIRNGDWVTPSRQYAVESGYDENAPTKVISTMANPDQLFWDGNSPNELGFDDGRSYAYKDTKNNRKLTDLVTYQYDEEGNASIVPLSKRFNFRESNTSYSIGQARFARLPDPDVQPELSFSLGRAKVAFHAVDQVHDESRIGTAKQGKKIPSQQDVVSKDRVTPEHFEKQLGLITHFTLPYFDRIANRIKSVAVPLPKFLGASRLSAKTRHQRLHQFFVDNLLFLYDLYDRIPNGAELRWRASLWYDGARLLAEEAMNEFAVTVEQAAAVFATLSPGKAWFQNVQMGRNLMDVWRNHMDTKVRQKDAKHEASIALYDNIPGTLAAAEGKTLRELYEAAKTDKDAETVFYWAFRVVTNEVHGLNYQVLYPEGGRGPIAMTNAGENAGMGWQASSYVLNAFSVLEDGSLDNISASISADHKVRNFYNNIIAPNNGFGDGTIDTHHVAAAFFFPLAQRDYQVAVNFGGSSGYILPDGSKTVSAGSAGYGLNGFYWAHLEALRDAAAQRGIQPRQMQSITWEMIRQVFKGKGPKMVADMAALWNDFRDAKDYTELRESRVRDFAPQFSWDDGTGWHGPDPRTMGGSGGIEAVTGATGGEAGDDRGGAASVSSRSGGSYSLGRATVIPTASTRAFPGAEGSPGVIGPASFSIGAWHGTPHQVDRFRLDRIGTGEGAQAYGWGLYFAENRDVANSYKQNLSGFDELVLHTAQGKKKGLQLDDIDLEVAKYLEKGERAAGQFRHNTVYYAKQQAEAAGLKEVVARLDGYGRDAKATYEKNTGVLYRVELDVDADELLDWDKPLSEQSEKVKKALESLGITNSSVALESPFSFEDTFEVPTTGDSAYQFLRERSSAEQASSKLLAAGIRGIRYLDGNSRGSGEGSYNYVIFDEAAIKITEENGTPVNLTQESGSFSLGRPWPANFPNVVISTTVGKMKSHPAYVSAKAGEPRAAFRVVNDLVKVDRLRELGRQFPGAIVAGLHAEEATGHNMLPEALADAIANHAGLELDEDIVIANTPKRTGSSAIHRLASRPEIAGNVKAGRQYILADDVATQGGTLSEARAYIEEQGGEVVAVVTMAAAQGGTVLAMSEKTRLALQEKFGNDALNEFAAATSLYGGQWQAFTNSEGLAILKYAKLETAKDSILAARKAAGAPVISPAAGGQLTQTTFEGFALSHSGILRIEEAVARRMTRGPDERLEFFERLRNRLAATVLQLREAKRNAGGFEAMSEPERERNRIRDAMAEVNAVIQALPAEARGRVPLTLSDVLDQDTERGQVSAIIRLIDQADEALETVLLKDYREAFEKLLDLAKPDLRQNKSLRGRLTPDTQRLVGHILEAVTLDSDQLAAALAAKQAEIDAQESLAPDTPEGVREAQRRLVELYQEQSILETFGAFSKMDAASTAAAYEALLGIYTTGRSARKILDENRRAEIEALRMELLSTLPESSQPRHAEKMAEKGIAVGAEAWRLGMSSFHQFMEWIFPESMTARDMQDRVRQADRAFTRMKLEAKDRFDRFIFSTWNLSGPSRRRQANRILADLSTLRDWNITLAEGVAFATEKLTEEQAAAILAGKMKTGWETDRIAMTSLENALADFRMQRLKAQQEDRQFRSRVIRFQRLIRRGSQVDFKASDLQALYYLQLYAQEQYRPALDKYGFTAEVMEAMEKQLNPRARDLGEFLRAEYDAEWQRLNPVYRAIYGLNMPRIRNYAPGAFEHLDAKGPGDDSTIDPSGAPAGVNAMAAGFTKTRTHHMARPREVNAMAKFWSHMEATNYFIAYAEVARDLRQIFRHPEVRRRVETAYGPQAARLLGQWLDAIEVDGNFRAVEMEALAAMTHNTLATQSAVGLAYNLGVLFKQLSASFGVLWEMPTIDALRGLTSLLRNPGRYAAVWQSEAIQQRVLRGINPEDRRLLDAAQASPSLILELLELGRLPIAYADAVFTGLSAAVAYSHHYDRAIQDGLTDAPA
ncbi:MAG: DUF7178 family protein, partial [Luteolibacter sp.]